MPPLPIHFILHDVPGIRKCSAIFLYVTRSSALRIKEDPIIQIFSLQLATNLAIPVGIFQPSLVLPPMTGPGRLFRDFAAKFSRLIVSISPERRLL